MSDTVDQKKISTAKSAAGQYLGYSLQQVRLCVYLLHRPSEDYVYMEAIDDVAVSHQDEFHILEQAKSALSQNPTTAWSQQLWDAIGHWVDLAESGDVDPAKVKFRYYVSPSKKSSFVTRMHAATDQRTADNIISDVATRRARLENAPACDKYVQKFLNGDKSLIQKIVSNFEIVTDDDPLEQVREYMRPAVSFGNLDAFCRSAIGIASTMIDDRIRNGSEPCVSAEKFRRKLHSHIWKYDTSRLVGSVIEDPEMEQLTGLLNEKRTFVHQMEVIHLNHRQKMRAVADYLKTRSATTLWAAEGRVLEESVKEFRDDLVREYEYVSEDLSYACPEASYEKIGARTFYNCCRVNKGIDGCEVPGFYIPGTYQVLADSIEVQWHPKYKELYENGVNHE